MALTEPLATEDAFFRALEQVETEMGIRKPKKSLRALFGKQQK